jgi:hypothetical protein
LTRFFCIFVIYFIRGNFVINELFPFSVYFLSNMILQCMTMYLYWEKPVWLWCQCCIKPNIATNTKSPGVSRNHEKSFYRTNGRVFIITVFKESTYWCLKNALNYVLKIFCYSPQDTVGEGRPVNFSSKLSFFDKKVLWYV